MDKWLVALITQMLKVVSPNIKKALDEFVLKLEADAKTTVNPWDDLLVKVLKVVLGL